MRPRPLQGVAAAVLALAALSASGDEIRVLSGGAARSFVEPLAKTLPNHTVHLDWQPMGRLVQSLARVGIGVAVHESAPLPDISTPQALRNTLLRAGSVVYIDPRTARAASTSPRCSCAWASPTKSTARRRWGCTR